MIESLKNILKTKTVQRIQKSKPLQGVIIAFFLLIASAIVWPSPKRQDSVLSTELQEIDRSITEARKKTDPFIRERFIQQEARKLKLNSDEYKKLYTLRKQDTETLPDAPSSPIEQVSWFYQGLTYEQRWTLMRIWLLWGFEKSSTLTILFVGGRFLWEIPRREREAKYQAWQVIHTAHGQEVSGARIAALEDLREQGESLDGLTLEEGADLGGINLTKANLRGAKLSRANLTGANLFGANLNDAYLNDAYLNEAKLTGAKLTGADLSKAKLRGADLRGGSLSNANLSGSDLSGADLSNADLGFTNLRNANLNGANLRNAVLWATKLSGTNFDKTIVKGTKFGSGRELTEDQKQDLRQRGAIFE